MKPEDNEKFLFSIHERPFGKLWEEWAALWCNWMLSIPRDRNPSLDETGKNCMENQTNPYVWFLGGTFGNIVPIKRRCTIPLGKAILFPILEKEDSFAEDHDLITEGELAQRASEVMDRIVHLEAKIDGIELVQLNRYRVCSRPFDLSIPKDSVYDLPPGTTRSVCDGIWIFLRPLPAGSHRIHFAGRKVLPKGDVVTEQIKSDSIYAPIKDFIDNKSLFIVDVTYDLNVR
jgi:hypothetical protein